MKTGIEIEQHVYSLLRASPIKDLITGRIYLSGMRPINSDKEDTVIIFQAALNGQFQDGSVNVNTYIPDIPFENGGVITNIKNVKRCLLIERACQDFASSIEIGKYRFSLASAIQTFEYEGNQHFVNMRLRFSNTTF